MSGHARIGRLLCSALAVAAAAASGQERIPVLNEIRDALEREIGQTSETEFCLPIDFPKAAPWGRLRHPSFSAPLDYGTPPFENIYAPGLFSAVIPNDGAGNEYLRMRARMEALVKLGYFSSAPITYVYQAAEPMRIQTQTYPPSQGTTVQVLPVEELRRPQPAIRFTLTRDGWFSTRGKPCLPIGKNELVDVQSIERSERNRQELAMVRYRVGIRPASIAPDMAATVRAFGENWNRQLEPRHARTTFLRTASGWISERQVQALLRGAAGAERQSSVDVAPPDPKTLQNLIDLYLAGAPDRGQTCIRLPAGSDVHDSRTWWRTAGPYEYDARFYHFPDANPERSREVSRGLALARDLERIGVMSASPATPFILHQPDELGGARFELRPDFYRYLTRDRPPACLAYAELGFDSASIRLQNRSSATPTVEFLAIAQPKRFYDWVEKTGADKGLPVIGLAQKYGIGVKGTARFTEKGGWRVEKMDWSEPAYARSQNWKESFASLPRASEYRKANAAKTAPEIQAIVVRSAGTARVLVNGTGRPLILHLSSGLPVEWRLTVGRGAKLARVVASAATSASVRGVPAGVPLNIYAAEARAGRPEKDDDIPSLVPPEERYYRAGPYATTLERFDKTNVGLVESRLGGEMTVVQTELGSKEFNVPRRWISR